MTLSTVAGYPKFESAGAAEGSGDFRYSATFLIEPGSANDKAIQAAITAEAIAEIGPARYIHDDTSPRTPITPDAERDFLLADEFAEVTRGGGAKYFTRDVGRLRAELRLSELRKSSAIAEYERAIQVAFREVADALAVRDSLTLRLAAQQAAVEASGSALELARARYQRGADSWLQVLDAQRTYDTARQALISLRQLQIDNGITLYKVLGGGVT